MEVPGLITGVFGISGFLGWDTRVPAVTSVGATAVAAGLVFAGLASLSRRRFVAMTILFALIVLLPLWLLQESLSIVGENVQARYVLPLVPAFIGVAIMNTTTNRTLSLASSQAFVMYALLVVAQAAALHYNIQRYVVGQDVTTLDLGRVVEWWWRNGPGPMTVWLAGSCAFALAALSLFRVGVVNDADTSGVYLGNGHRPATRWWKRRDQRSGDD